MPDEATYWCDWLAAQGVRPVRPPCVTATGRRPRLLVARRAPRETLAAWAGAWQAGWDVFLADPAWGGTTREDFCQRVGADAVSADDHGWTTAAGRHLTFAEDPIVAIPTGGSSGSPKLAAHTAATLSESARAGVEHLLGGRHRTLSLLPAHHVSGLMPTWRAAASGGKAVWADWKTWREQPSVDQGFVLSLVPTQLAQLRERDPSGDSLRKAGAILLGGAAAPAELLAWARKTRLPLAPCYGMTETAAFVAACLPEEFLDGRDDLGTAVGNASLATDVEGRLHIESPALFLGYWPETRETGAWATADSARLSPDGRLTLLGRLDNLIICGGEKASPARIEAFLRGTGLVADVAVAGEPDPVWGARVAAGVVLAEGADPQRLAQLAEAGLPPWERPRRWIWLREIPRTAAGKTDRNAMLGDSR